MKRLLLVGSSILALLFQPLVAYSETKDQVVGAILGIILNEAIKDQGTTRSGSSAPTGTADAPRVVKGPQQPKMNKEDWMAVQRTLADAGFYDGAIDGAIGPASRSAIAAWQESMGAEGSGYLTRDQADTLIAVAPPKMTSEPDAMPPVVAAAEVDGEAIQAGLAQEGLLIDLEDGRVSREMQAALYREFLVRYTLLRSERLDDEAFVSQILSHSAQIDAFRDPRVAEWNEAASRGTEFERQIVHDEFVAYLGERMTDAPLTFVKVKRISFPEYDFTQDRFPLKLADIFRLRDRTYFGPGGGINVVGDPGAWTSVSAVDVPVVEAEVISKQIHAMNGFADVVMRVTLSNFRQGADGEVTGDVQVDSVSVHLPTDLSNGAFGELVVAVPDPALVKAVGGVADIGQAKDALDSWARLGAPVDDDRLMLQLRDSAAQDQLELAYDYLALAGSPDSTLSISEIAYYGVSFLDDNEQISLFGGDVTDDRFALAIAGDEFALAEIKDRFASTFGPALRARAPLLPVPARLTFAVRLGEYDFDREVFPISIDPNGYGNRGVASEPEPLAIQLTSQPEFRTLLTDVVLTTTEIPMGRAEAKAMSARLKSDAQRQQTQFGMTPDVYLAVDLSLNAVKAAPESKNSGFTIDSPYRRSDTALAFTASVAKAVLYEDAALTRPILELPLERLMPDVSPVAFVQGSAMPEGTLGSQTGALAYALQQGVDPSVLTEIAEAAASATGADEFTRPEIAEELMAMVQGATVPDGTVYFKAQVTLGEYTDGAFPISKIGYFRHDLYSPSGYMLPGDTVSFLVGNPDAFPRLPLDRTTARDLAKMVPSRTFEALVEVGLGAATILPASDGSKRRQVQVELTNFAMHLADPKDITRRLFVVQATEAAAKQVDAGDKAATKETNQFAADVTAPAEDATAVAATATVPAAVAEGRDIVGLLLGMSLDEATDAIKQHMTVSRVLEWRSETALPNVVGELARLYINDAGNEFIIVNFGPIAFEPRVTAISRNLFLPLGAVSDDDLATQLVQKYGDPDAGMGWQWSAVPGLYGCADGGQQMTLSWVGATVIEGPEMPGSTIDSAKAATDPAYAAEVLILARTSNLMYGLGPNNGAPVECGETVRSEILRNWSNQVTTPPIAGDVSDLFVTRLIDQATLRRQMEDALKAEKDKLPEVEIKL